VVKLRLHPTHASNGVLHFHSVRDGLPSMQIDECPGCRYRGLSNGAGMRVLPQLLLCRSNLPSGILLFTDDIGHSYLSNFSHKGDEGGDSEAQDLSG
jgi:hypothetical protein